MTPNHTNNTNVPVGTISIDTNGDAIIYTGHSWEMFINYNNRKTEITQVIIEDPTALEILFNYFYHPVTQEALNERVKDSLFIQLIDEYIVQNAHYYRQSFARNDLYIATRRFLLDNNITYLENISEDLLILYKLQMFSNKHE